VGGVREAAWPLIRADFSLTYIQIGLLMTLPGILGSIVEPVLGILADTSFRRAVFLAGGIAFGLSAFLTAGSAGPSLLLVSWILFSPASGAFVNVAQIALMDRAPRRREQNMARWSLAGSIGMSAGPIVLAAAASAGLGWRGLYGVLGVISAALLVPAWRTRLSSPAGRAERLSKLAQLLRGLRGALRALRSLEVLRWLVLLELADLMLDILFGFVALYFVDGAGATTGQAALAVAVWTLSGLLGDYLVIRLLERVPGLLAVRVGAAAALVLFPGFLLAPALPLKLALLFLLGLVKASWYPVLKARLYHSLPGRGGAAMALSNVSGLVGCLLPLALSAAATALGLKTAMWLLLAAPVSLLVGLPRSGGRPRGRTRPGRGAAPRSAGRRASGQASP
jgi:FSR family fosmidomycin resistance protein-like MFS transporter